MHTIYFMHGKKKRNILPSHPSHTEIISLFFYILGGSTLRIGEKKKKVVGFPPHNGNSL